MLLYLPKALVGKVLRDADGTQLVLQAHIYAAVGAGCGAGSFAEVDGGDDYAVGHVEEHYAVGRANDCMVAVDCEKSCRDVLPALVFDVGQVAYLHIV